jgi:hypothetical protein
MRVIFVMTWTWPRLESGSLSQRLDTHRTFYCHAFSHGVSAFLIFLCICSSKRLRQRYMMFLKPGTLMRATSASSCRSLVPMLSPRGRNGSFITDQMYNCSHYSSGGWRMFASIPEDEEAFFSEEAQRQGLEEYQELKDMLLRRTWKFGALFSVYLFLVAPKEASNASLLELVGSAAGYGYLWLLMRDVDSYNEDSDTPMFEVERIDSSFFRNLAKIGVGYRYSLNPRLLIPCSLALACFAYNSTHDVSEQIGLVEEGCLIGGFLGYKVSLFTKIYDDLKPKVLTAEELMKEKRPDLVEMDDVDESLLWDKKAKDRDISAS